MTSTTQTGGKVKLRLETLRNVPGRPKSRPLYWVTGLPWDECGRVRCGPYEDRKEAMSDLRGMQDIFNNEDYV